ncbi:MAG: dihydroorotase [Rhodospirillales bacterium]|nr:dihydroorotase [Rhodospirillales bacterium]MSP80282.1 dihydroorotase [Rhodospirillales bacterium]
MPSPPSSIVIRRPDDWHLHLRDGAMLGAVLPFTARVFGRAIVMPNLVPPVTTAAGARAYRARIEAACPPGSGFRPLMTCYLTDRTDADEVARGFGDGAWVAAKYYPANATTHSESGVSDVRHILSVLARMEKIGMPLLVHGEVTDANVDVFDREAVFLDRVLGPLVRDFPGLKVVFEHATTEDAVAFVRAHAPGVGATLTPHHLMINRNAMFEGGIRPHLYCLPVAKREKHRQALRRAAVSGEACFFLGTDSAPHPRAAKESDCGCAGIFNAPAAIEAYAQVFAEEGALAKLEAFASLNGPAFYGLPANEERIKLAQAETRIPNTVPAPGDTLRPFLAGETLGWRIEA